MRTRWLVHNWGLVVGNLMGHLAVWMVRCMAMLVMMNYWLWYWMRRRLGRHWHKVVWLFLRKQLVVRL